MAEIYYLSLADVLALHEAIMQKFGLPPAPLREEGLLESADLLPIIRPASDPHKGGRYILVQPLPLSPSPLASSHNTFLSDDWRPLGRRL